MPPPSQAKKARLENLETAKVVKESLKFDQTSEDIKTMKVSFFYSFFQFPPFVINIEFSSLSSFPFSRGGGGEGGVIITPLTKWYHCDKRGYL